MRIICVQLIPYIFFILVLLTYSISDMISFVSTHEREELWQA